MKMRETRRGWRDTRENRCPWLDELWIGSKWLKIILNEYRGYNDEVTGTWRFHGKAIQKPISLEFSKKLFLCQLLINSWLVVVVRGSIDQFLGPGIPRQCHLAARVPGFGYKSLFRQRLWNSSKKFNFPASRCLKIIFVRFCGCNGEFQGIRKAHRKVHSTAHALKSRS